MEKKPRYFYGLSDTFAGHMPKEYTSGFCNTTCAVAFKSKKERDAWVSETRLLKAKPISRKKAIRLTDWDRSGLYTMVKEVDLFGTEEKVVILERSF